MPLYRFINPPSGLEDATYLYDTNPDPERYEEAVPRPTKKAAAPSEETS